VAVSNRERVGRAFEALAEGLGPFVDHQMRTVHGEGWLEGFVESGYGHTESRFALCPVLRLWPEWPK